MPRKRDTAWAEMLAVAQQLSSQYGKDDTLEVRANRQQTGLSGVSEGLAVGDKWDNDVFEPVRHRRIFGRHWREVQTLEQAAEGIEKFLRERPDLGSRQFQI